MDPSKWHYFEYRCLGNEVSTVTGIKLFISLCTAFCYLVNAKLGSPTFKGFCKIGAKIFSRSLTKNGDQLNENLSKETIFLGTTLFIPIKEGFYWNTRKPPCNFIFSLTILAVETSSSLQFSMPLLQWPPQTCNQLYQNSLIKITHT